MFNIMKKNRSRLLALAATLAFLTGELAGFAVPQEAMAETIFELNAYTMRVNEDTLELNAVHDFNAASADGAFPRTYEEVLNKGINKTYTIYVDGEHPNYEIFIPIKINGVTGPGGGSVKSLDAVHMRVVYDHDDNLWDAGLGPHMDYDRYNYEKEFEEKIDKGQPVEVSFNITYRGSKQEDGNCCPYIVLEYEGDNGRNYTICPLKVEFKRNGESGKSGESGESSESGESGESGKSEEGGKSGENGKSDEIKIPRIRTDKLPKATVSENYSAKIETENISDAEFKSDNLPDWLSLDKTSGKLNGVPRKTGDFGFTVTVTGKDSNGAEVRLAKDYTIKVKGPSDHKDNDDHRHDQDSKPSSWEENPNEKSALVMTASGMGAGVTVGRQEQGEIAKALFKASTPVGWNETFSFNMMVNGKADYSLKSGTFTLQIPAEYQKAGRQFAILAMGKNGQVFTLPDTDTNPATITVNVNFDGYAMDLIYKD